jgi:UPF0716 protein FxsA
MVTLLLRLWSNSSFAKRPIVRMPLVITVYFALWLGAELAAFGAVVHAIGFMGAVALCIVTSIAGLGMLRRMGVSAVVRLRQAAASNASEHNGLSREKLANGALAGLGAMLLILPGFVSDLAGLALAAPSVRLWVIERLNLGRIGRVGGRPGAPALIELSPREWSRLESRKPDSESTQS